MSRIQASRAVFAALAVAIAASGVGSFGHAASSSTVVTMDVPSATTLDATSCASGIAGRTSFGVVQPGSSVVTSGDCEVAFGSSNDRATLRVFSGDGSRPAMSARTTATVETIATNRVMALEMATSSVGWLAGRGGSTTKIRRTGDGGATWAGVGATVSAATIGSLSVVSSTVAWGAERNGNEVVRTIDGSTWTTSTISGSPKIDQVGAFDGQVAWVTGSWDDGGVDRGAIWHTSNGGAAWSRICSECIGGTPRDVATTSATTGFVVTSSGVIASITGGTTVTQVINAIASWRAIDMADSTYGVVVGDSGEVRTTVDGGASWASRDTGVRYNLNQVSYLADGTIWAFGDKGVILRSPDRGASWSIVELPVDPTRMLGDAVGTTVVVGAAGPSVFRSTNSGTTWTAASTPVPTTNWNAVDAVDAGAMWRVGSLGAIQFSSTTGATWATQASGLVGEGLHDVVAVSRSSAVAVGGGGRVIRTIDGGTSWTVGSGSGSTALRSVAVSGDGTGMLLAGGDGGVLLRSWDRGATWAPAASGTTANIWSVAAWTRDRILVATSAGELRRSLDGGASWTTLTTPAARAIVGVAAVPGTDTAWIAWDDNVSRTTDLGVTWTDSELEGKRDLADLDVWSAGSAAVSGRWGNVFLTSDAGTTWTRHASSSATVFAMGVTMLGPDSWHAAGEAGLQLVPGAPVTIPDHSGGTASWSTGDGFFGICLRQVVSGTAAWSSTGACSPADDSTWSALPAHGGLAGSVSASTTSPGTATARFRYGLRVPPAQPPGTYRAGVVFEVTAPT